MKANRFIRVQLCPSVTLILPLSQQFERFSPNGDFESVNSDIRVKSGRLAHGSSGRTRTYNPSVNSRVACSRLVLQTKDLQAPISDFRGNWGDSGGTSLSDALQLCPSRLNTCSIFVFTAACMAVSSRPARTSSP